MITLSLALSLGCMNAWRHAPEAFSADPFDAAIVPGCPATDEGTVSECQWRRASWASELVHAGSVENVVVSGAAVYNPYSEAEGLRAALLALGVDDARIIVEPTARHTDENAARALRICEERGWQRLAVASDGAHAVLIDKMISEWSDADVVALPGMNFQPLTVPRIELAAQAGWLPPEQVDEDRPAPFFSLPSYIWKGVSSPFLDHAAPQ